MGKGTRVHRHSAEVKAAAIGLAREKGPAQAAREMGLPQGTVSCWLCVARKREGAPSAVESEGSASCTALASATASAPEPEGAGRKRASRVAKVYTPSERARALECVDKFGISKTHRMLGISRFTLYDWRRKVALAALGKISSSIVSGSDEDPRLIRDRKILKEWKRHPGLGPSQIRNQLRRNGFKVSVHTVRCVMMENGYVQPKIRRTGSHDNDYEAIRPNHLWHLDFLSRYIHKQKIFVLLIVDDYSRFIVGNFITDAERGNVVLNSFERAVGLYGRPEAAMSDGGSAFYAWQGISKFTNLLEELEVDQIVVDVPQKNGKLEVLNANVQKELFNQEKFFNLAQTARRLESWISFYNYRRTHHALGGLLVPADRYFGRADEVLAQIEAGRTPDGVSEPIPVCERILDILRVTTHNGEVSVTLMGQQIWPVRT